MVTAEERVQAAFAHVCITSPQGEFYLPASAAAEYLDACSRAGLAIAGVEAFQRDGVNLKPRLDLIADFSELLATSSETWTTVAASSIGEALHFVRSVVGEQSALWLSFVAVAEAERK